MDATPPGVLAKNIEPFLQIYTQPARKKSPDVDVSGCAVYVVLNHLYKVPKSFFF